MNINHIAKKPFFDLFYRTPCMPIILRAALYDATLHTAAGKPRGPTGTVGLQNQINICNSADITFAMKNIEEMWISGNHMTKMLTYGDLIQLGGYAAVEYCGGPVMQFEIGRSDLTEEGMAIKHEPETHLTSLVAKNLAQTECLTDAEFVALMGFRTLGFIGEEKKGPHTRWTKNPFVFDNDYFKELLKGDQSKHCKVDSDWRLVQEPKLKEWVEKYAEDENLFFMNYARAHVKVSRIGFEDQLMSEVDSKFVEDGGYREPSRIKPLFFAIRSIYNSKEAFVDMIEDKKADNQVKIEEYNRQLHEGKQ